MESSFTQKDMLAQVNQLWSMLDDMAENSPESYQKFIQRHMKEGKEFMTPPEPNLCIHTKILEPDEKILFINICQWNRVPAPMSEAHPVPISAGQLENLSDGTVVAIAYNPEVLKRAHQDHVELDQLIRLAMKYIEEQYQITLCHSYHVAPFQLKGNAKMMKESLERIQKQPATNKGNSSCATDNSLLEELKSIALIREKQETSPSICITREDVPKSTKIKLIEEISSTDLQNRDLLPSPWHELSVTKDNAGHPQSLILKVKLRGVHSVAECDLSVSKDDLLLVVPGRYRLLLNLPQAVNEETVAAKFNKANYILLVTMPTL
nr:novel protein [Xenopus tropicalis]|eukprot:XP_017950851.1 PREDICTED: PIH1 domain-containing protein 2 isoform X1 [Xenopus tropicalis]